MSGFVGIFDPKLKAEDRLCVADKMLIAQFSGREASTKSIDLPGVGLTMAWSLELPYLVKDGESGNQVIAKGHLSETKQPHPHDHEWGCDTRFLTFLSDLNGFFCGLLFNQRAQRACLFNDRFGLERVYVCGGLSGALYFSTQAKSILEVLPETRSLDESGVSEYLGLGCTIGNKTLFNGISLLPVASAWFFRADQRAISKATYFDPQVWENQEPLSTREYANRLIEIFPSALRRASAPESSRGMSLTGGLDGRMIMAWERTSRGSLPCYTFSGEYRESADVRVARRIAETCSQPYRTIKIGSDFFTDFAKLAFDVARISEGTMDSSGAVELYLNKVAREISPVRLTGNYGSEILRRHVAFRPRRFSPSILQHHFVQLINQASTRYASEASVDLLTFIAFKQVPWHHFARLSIERSQLRVETPFLDNELVKLAFRAPSSPGERLDAIYRLIRKGRPELALIPNDRGVILGRNSIFDRLRGAFCEVLAKGEYGYDYGMPSWASRIDSYFRWLRFDRAFLGWQKFAHFRLWYRDRLGEFLRQILLDERSRRRGYLLPGASERLIRAHTSGQENYTTELHKLLGLEILQRILIDRT